MSAIKRISDRALAQLKKRYQPSDFRPTFKGYNMYGKPIYKKPKVSLRMLNVMRKNLDYLQRDPTSIGLPIKPEKRPPRLKKPKRPKYERDAPKRRQKIQKSLEEMPKVIETWRKEKRLEKEKNKPSLPF
ncbi:14172_t:CDS:2 [Entrophospora sp. SA101]|nr:10435_t:CDS:2 [Entrophospora candida]CAJ0826356.1 14172_t:CDS:2 [Entrophospora sp. SA101]CAJ0837819.1 6373_t:CDS:2 [Entrophospora sp. SA101]CAJ0842951.1 12727_t:CDS:2 [Entrophospora sp. SA101]